MNEITKIHLGRQAFIVSVDAYKALQEYLRAIKKHMGDSSEAVEEVEMRMAELLAERGIRGNKVMLLKDVDYLKSQLGKPGDFGDEEAKSENEEAPASKRLFRDTKHGLIAGVAAGLAAYFGVRPVIVRVLFVLLLLSGFGGLFNVSLMGGFWLMVLVYIALWVAIPEANSGSDRLKMQGKPVTVDAIKDAVERADFKTAATRMQHIVESVVSGVMRVITAAVGFGLMLAGIAALLGTTTIGVYWALNHDMVPSQVFPVGASEVALVGLGVLVVVTVALFFIVTGLAVTRRRWPLPSWGLGAIVAVFLASLAVGGALTADAAPKISLRYEAAKHSYVRTVPEFDTLHVISDSWVRVRYEQSPTYSVVGNYWGDAKFSDLKTDSNGQALTIDTRPLAQSLQCRKLCLWRSQMAEVVVRGPNLKEVTTDLQDSNLTLSKLHNQTVKVHAVDGSISFTDIVADTLQAKLDKDGTWTLTAAGDYVDPTYSQEASFYGKDASMTARNIDLTFNGTCGLTAELSTGPSISIGRFDNLTVNGEKIGTPSDLRALYDKPGSNPAKCLSIPSYLTDNL